MSISSSSDQWRLFISVPETKGLVLVRLAVVWDTKRQGQTLFYSLMTGLIWIEDDDRSVHGGVRDLSLGYLVMVETELE